MPVAARNLMTLDEFLAWEREQPERYEFAAVPKLSSIGVEITLDAIYEDTELDATQPPADGMPARAG
jgi:hypothetical protein